MTKVTKLASLIGGEKEQGKKKPIEFVKHVGFDGTLPDRQYCPKDYDNVILLATPKGTDCPEEDIYDIIGAWDNDFTDNQMAIYLGHCNDGVVE